MYNNMEKKSAIVIVGLLLLTGSVFAQKTWDKPLEKWSKDDAMKVVMDSPWATTYQDSRAAAAVSQQQIARDSRDTAGGIGNSKIDGGGNGLLAGSSGRNGGPAPVVIRLHSGYPIRQAIIRGRQLAANYDKMDSQKKKEFDESSKGFLACAICKNYYVISITKLPDSTSESVEEAIFERSTLNDLKGNVWLINDKGEKREIFQFTAPKKTGESAYLFFARNDEKGNPLVSPDTKNFKLVFAGNFFVSSNPYAIYIPRTLEFNPSKLMVHGELMF